MGRYFKYEYKVMWYDCQSENYPPETKEKLCEQQSIDHPTDFNIEQTLNV